MSRLSCVQKCLCPDFRAFKNAYVLTFVRSKRKFVRSKNNNLCVHVQTFVRSKMPMSRLSCVPKENSCAPKIIICAFMSRLSCVQKCLCPDFRAFKNAYVLTFVRSKRKFVRSKFNNLCVDVQTIVRSEGLMSRLSCVQKCLCPDFLYVQKLTMCTKFDDLISPRVFSLVSRVVSLVSRFGLLVWVYDVCLWCMIYVSAFLDECQKKVLLKKSLIRGSFYS